MVFKWGFFQSFAQVKVQKSAKARKNLQKSAKSVRFFAEKCLKSAFFGRNFPIPAQMIDFLPLRLEDTEKNRTQNIECRTQNVEGKTKRIGQDYRMAFVIYDLRMTIYDLER